MRKACSTARLRLRCRARWVTVRCSSSRPNAPVRTAACNSSSRRAMLAPEARTVRQCYIGSDTLKIKKANMKRLASLSALGAGAVSANAGAAYASSIVYSGVLNEQLRFDRPFLNSGTFAGPNGPAASLHVRFETSPQHSSLYSVRLNARSGAHGTQFRFLGRSLVGAFPIGRNWSTAATRRNVGAGDQLAFHKYTYGKVTPSTPPTLTPKTGIYCSNSRAANYRRPSMVGRTCGSIFPQRRPGNDTSKLGLRLVRRYDPRRRQG